MQINKAFVIRKCSLCGHEKICLGTDNSYFVHSETAQAYQCGISEGLLHDCGNGVFGVYKIVGVKPVKTNDDEKVIS